MRIILTHGGSPVAKGIRLFLRGKFSHAALLFPDNTVIEAVWPKVRSLPYDEWVKEQKPGTFQIFTVETTDAQTEDVYTYASEQVGKPYDIIGDLHFVTRQDYPTQPDDKWFCSELDFESFYTAGVYLFTRTRGQDVSPDLLARSILVL